MPATSLHRITLLVSLAASACTSTPPGNADTADAGTHAHADAGHQGTADAGASPADAGGSTADAGNSATDAGMMTARDAATVDAHVPAEDAGQVVDCAALAGADVQVCSSTADSCGAVFSAGQGCQQLCASAGLACINTYEDVTGACEADTTRAALGCGTTGHVSDYCVCGPAGSTPQDAGTPPDTDAGMTTGNPCTAAALLAERAGYGRNTTGGDPSRRYTVTTLSGGTSGSGNSGSLRRALESDEPWWIVFNVDGRITFNEDVQIRSNKTIDGRGRDIELNGTVRIMRQRNIIISDVKMMNDLTAQCGQEGDVLLLSGAAGSSTSDFETRDVWVNHVEFHNGGDGLMDLRGATNVTVSWSHLHTHSKGMLMWRGIDQEDAPGMRVTLHHNFFDRLSIRGPQFIFGRLHYFNNYQFEWFDYGAGCLGGAQCQSERNVFRARNACNYCEDTNPCGDQEWFPDFTQAFVNDWDTNGSGSIRSVDDLLLNGAVVAVRNAEAVFDPAADYAYNAEPATEALAERIRSGAGPRTTLQCNR